ncbi:bifunctional hydroxymethylpyrimidine kinase/phosphomethylpyrimidine kinase [Methylobacillus flagellatus]|uniref:hydroxymethylpyrimidine kinase n=1 Tax=Methylobacillus flagellatus (strain ATCC 51484 / DSM 6875 / VKM B-1610 / KT) TaxID=265072 RepID=Q1H2M2_METFK|nr:bifunctional hydroxymethylpyrimidine kinase/phosphomethylpyrimidine kinase [Methylobacillus flagellatus]ABE49121.1 Phosphomethylpyrimidine kinase [Methylobacillus flagellatus KT]ABE49265.1 Phosphomethylpyrimidine kinase [Methylobacillus flagellatus KT]
MNASLLLNAANRYPRVLSIAGSDSSGGAGIQADLKTFSALGCYGMTAITALTAQNTQGVRAIHSVPPEMLRDQIDAVVEDIGVDAVKIGMLHSPEVVMTVAEALDTHGLEHVVLDPVMVAANGAKLISDEAISVLVKELFPRALVVTPNLDEAALLLGRSLTGTDELEQAAQDLLGLRAQAILLKGGHLPGHDVLDILVQANAAGQVTELHKLHSLRISTHNLHGTGCTLSSAIAAYLALGFSLPDAVQAARIYVRSALYAGSNVRTGAGIGPLNHGFAPQAMKVWEA